MGKKINLNDMQFIKYIAHKYKKQVAFAVIGSADMSGPRYDGRPELLRLHRLRLHGGTEIKVADLNGFAVIGSAKMTRAGKNGFVLTGSADMVKHE
jgi:hypothetical protein